MHPPTSTNLLCDVVDDRPISRLQYQVMVLCGLLAVLDRFDTHIIGFVVTAISSTLGMAPQVLSPVFAVGLFGLMLGAPAGCRQKSSAPH